MTSLLCLAFTIYYEAGNQPLLGKIAVAQVVMSRAKEPENICETISSPAQFSYMFDGKIEKIPTKNKLEVQAWGESYRVASAILAEGGDGSNFANIVGGATHYHTKDLEKYPCWSHPDYIQIQDHLFFPKVKQCKVKG